VSRSRLESSRGVSGTRTPAAKEKMAGNLGKKGDAETERKESKIRSREVMQNSGDKFNELYNLAKKLHKQPREDRTSEEVEFIKS